MSQFQIAIPPDFSFRECLWFLDRNYDDCLYSVSDTSVIRPIRVDDVPVLFEVRQKGESLEVSLLNGDGEKTRNTVEAYVRDWLDLDRDIAGFYELLKTHPVLSYMPEEFSGLRLIGIPDLFEAICWCIIGQQINLSFAYKLKRRMVESYGESLEWEAEVHHLFPKPEVLAELDREDLKALQFSRQKADYVIHVAQLVSQHVISKEQLLALPDREAQLKALVAVKGIGEWTANYVLMKTVKDMNCITIGDTSLNSALEAHELVKNKKDKEEVRRFFDDFADWKSYLNIYLWRSLSAPDFTT